MIRLYGFYSVGGYKDMYMGILNAKSNSAYYLPLLPIMRQRRFPEEAFKIAELDKLDKIRIITKSKTFDFPNECKSLFSHGGYTIMYRTLNNKSVCLAIRNLSSSMVDEEGRSNPFTLLFIADDQTDISLLDNAALYCLSHHNNLNNILSPTILYDAVVNGLRVDLFKIYSWIASCKAPIQFIHTSGYVDYVMLATRSSLPIVIQEHNIDGNKINAVVLENGNVCDGKLRMAKKEEEIMNCDVNAILKNESAVSLERKQYEVQIEDGTLQEQSIQKKEDINNYYIPPKKRSVDTEMASGVLVDKCQEKQYVTIFGHDIIVDKLPLLLILIACISLSIGFVLGMLF